jgi:hypothetical protein
MLVATSPAVADSTRQPSDDVRSNPFCDPAMESGHDPVQLASGDKPSALWLKPIGKAIGLKSLPHHADEPTSDSNLLIEPVTGSIQNNPLIESVHREHLPLVQTSTILLKPVKTVKAESEPIEYSLSDRQRPPAQSAIIEPSTDDLRGHLKAPQEFGGPRAVVLTPPQKVVEVPENSPQPPVAPPSPAKLTVESPAPLTPPSPIQLIPPSSAQLTRSAAGDRSSSERSKRYRPPVEVEPVPSEIKRLNQGGSSDGPVRAVAAFPLDSVPTTTSVSGQATILQLDVASVRSLTIAGSLKSVEVADPLVCQAVSSGPNQVKLIGTGIGVTRLMLTANADASGQSPLQRAFEIHVIDAPTTNAESLAETAATLNHSIQEAFPHCQVVVQQQRAGLMVAGRCDSQQSAKKIMRMVRKTCLVPVADELIVP